MKPLFRMKAARAGTRSINRSTIVRICAFSCSIVAPARRRAIIRLNSLPRSASDRCAAVNANGTSIATSRHGSSKSRAARRRPRYGFAVDADVASDDGRIAPQLRRPERVGQDDDAIGAGDGVGVGEAAAQARPASERREKRRRHRERDQLFGSSPPVRSSALRREERRVLDAPEPQRLRSR